MIRRLFWLVAGAVLGVSGYRRASRLARAIRPVAGRGAGPAGRGPGPGGASKRRRSWARGTARFAGDVREGMELYLDRHPGSAGRSLGGQQAPGRAGGQAAARANPAIDYAKDGR